MPASIIDLNEIVRVENISDEAWSDMSNGIGYTIPAGAALHIPLSAVTTWLGNIAENATERRTAVEKIRLKYMPEGSPGDWEFYAPPLRVFRQGSDERIYFPADDPDMEMADYRAETAGIGTGEEKLKRQLEQQAREIAELREMMGGAPRPAGGKRPPQKTRAFEDVETDEG